MTFQLFFERILNNGLNYFMIYLRDILIQNYLNIRIELSSHKTLLFRFLNKNCALLTLVRLLVVVSGE